MGLDLRFDVDKLQCRESRRFSASLWLGFARGFRHPVKARSVRGTFVKFIVAFPNLFIPYHLFLVNLTSGRSLTHWGDTVRGSLVPLADSNCAAFSYN